MLGELDFRVIFARYTIESSLNKVSMLCAELFAF